MNKLYTSLIPVTLQEAFYNTIAAIALDLNVKPEWLLLVLHSESGLNPQAVARLPSSVPGYNEYGKLIKAAGVADSLDPFVRAQYRATGINQLMPATAHGLGTSTQEVYKENVLQQLAHVKRFYMPFRDKIHSFADMYLFNFMPAYVGRDEETVLPHFVYLSNLNLDTNKDGQITIQEFKALALSRVPSEYKNYV